MDMDSMANVFEDLFQGKQCIKAIAIVLLYLYSELV
jgi:hypothetical protein